ncbi:hypothetical protein TNCV_3582051 [Trichonephila clavipes]|nr:hypothetical protein TNCV_3582051 [Trichonephila clavipes]
MLYKELWRLGPDGPGDEKTRERSPALDGEKGKSPTLDRESTRGEPWLVMMIVNFNGGRANFGQAAPNTC